MRKISKRLKFRERSTLDLDRAVENLDYLGSTSRRSTSVLLEDHVVRELKRLADTREVSYQKLLRALILDGLKRVERIN